MIENDEEMGFELPKPPAFQMPTGHQYLSTACLHNEHDYCQTETRRYDGTIKIAASCKFCGARCTCPCHEEGPLP